MSPTYPSAGIAAAIDRDRAELRHLVATTREHVDADACAYPGTCAGPTVVDVLAEIPVDELTRLMAMAVAELAAAGYGHDLDDPARALLAGLELSDGDDDDRD